MITVTKAALQAGLSRTRILKLIADGRIKAILEHGRWMIADDFTIENAPGKDDRSPGAPRREFEDA